MDEALYTTRDIVIPAGTMVAVMAMECFDAMEPVEFAMVDIGTLKRATEAGDIAPLESKAA